MLPAASPTALIANELKRNISIAPINAPTKTVIFEMSTVTVNPTCFATSSRYALNNKKAASAADPIAYPFVNAFVVFPTASSLSVLFLTSAGEFDIDAMPPALSVIGPKLSIARTYAAVASIPIVATAVPYNPPLSIPLRKPRWYDKSNAPDKTITGNTVASIATANPEIMFVACPVTEAFAMLLTGLYVDSV